MLVSPTEPRELKAIGKVSAIPERNGADFLIVGKNGRLGIQRKLFPQDLLASLADGRLYEQVHQMQVLDHRALILEGHGRWTMDGELLDVRQFSRQALYGLFFTLAFEFGVQVFWVKDMKETTQVLRWLEAWFAKERHDSLRRRPGPKGDSWGKKGNREYACHLLQSFPGVGAGLASNIFDHFGRAPLKWDVDGVEKLMEVPGIGKGKAEKMWEALG